MLDFVIYDEKNNQIGSVSRKFFTIGDKYEIEIYDQKHLAIILSIVVTIANDVNRNQNSSN